MRRLIFRWPWLNLILIFATTLFFILQMPHLDMDNDTFHFIPDDDEAVIAMEDFMEQYGSDFIMALVLSNPYKSFLEIADIQLISELTTQIEKINGVISVESIANTDYISGANGNLTVTPLSQNSEGEILSSDEIGRRINSWDLYSRLLLSEDKHSTLIGITIDEDREIEEKEETYLEILRITAKKLPDSYSYNLAGLPATTIQISKNMTKDISLLIPFVVLLVIFILFISFKRFYGIFLPLLNVSISTIWTLGLMSLFKVPLTVLSSIIPVLMIAVGSAYGIHLVSHYFDEMDLQNPQSKKDKKNVVLHSVKIVGIPIAMAGLTTVAGFGSLMISTVIPMRSFGIFTALGVASALIVALTLIPSILILFPGKSKKIIHKKKEFSLLAQLTTLTLNKKRTILAISIFLVIGSAIFIPKVVVDNDAVAYFKEDTPIRKADKLISEKFAGTNSFNIVVSGENAGDLNNPEILVFMENYKLWIEENYSDVGKVMSYSGFIKRINQVLHEDDAGRVSLNETVEKKPLNNYIEEKNNEGNGDFPEDDSFFSDDFGEDSFESDSFFDKDFEDNSFNPESSGGLSIEPSVSPKPLSSLISNSSKLMDTLWDAYRTDPENFMIELARITNHKGFDYYEIPVDPSKYGLESNEDLSNMISQFLLLYSGNLSQWSDEALEPSQARMMIQLNKNGSRIADEIIPGLQKYANDNLPSGYTISFAGMALIQSSLTHLIVRSAIRSIILAIILVFIILAITYRSPVAGLIGIIPLSMTVLVTFGVMGLTGVALDISTAMVGSIAIGIGIDYTIHFLSSYARHYREELPTDEITRLTMQSSGKAILYNALSVAAGFAVLLFSRFNPLMYLGALIVLTMGVSSLTSLTLLPILLNTLKPRFLKRLNKKENLSLKIKTAL